MDNEIRQAGMINQRVIDLLGLTNVSPNTPILVGTTNVEHMKKHHPNDFEQYGCHLEDILHSPTYVAKHPSNGSIQYIKVYQEGDDHVMVAVRITTKGTVFARTLFVMSENKVQRYKERGALKEY
ncbi:PBECR2 nuclease fold domain-containing protein [Aquibacillus sp. 3ASR75-11]|uniref:PBECR2 nuclease fold domain-containing protein n=1 Tax=Terrihalobacillus insolitus TaxID=2950438 RepID=A0A9X3WQR2_9BACI|nr:PBECR2 nuclease fold domain-containing protein [Terrihalobacillus insolitus]MDC3414067.1 PBECR2 nuclease fold domain-containing protein [Terrihalobacillus insolitus]MDC3424157.1 PBECR2 nuclease fold domain-containing protein [Terrihalobacillus insolitus]